MTDTTRIADGEEHFHIDGPLPDKKLFLRLLRASGSRTRHQSPVLYVHGATFPSALSVAYRCDGRSWRDALCASGFDVWGLDFYGFGLSDRYPQMAEPAEAHPPLGLAVEAVQFMKVALQEPLPQVWIPSALAAGVATAALFLCTVRIANRSHR